MGTDIHMFVERRVDGTWVPVAPPEPPPASERTEKRTDREGKEYDYVSPFWGPNGAFYTRACYKCRPKGQAGWDAERGAGCDACLDTGWPVDWYHNRNYNVFAILTGTVRNGRGFAGCDTGNGFRGIVAEPRGLPEDASAFIKEHAAEEFDHSAGWLSLAEILAFDWTQVTSHRGVIPVFKRQIRSAWEAVAYEDWRDREPRTSPGSYSGDVGGGGSVVLTMPQADRLLAAAAPVELEIARSVVDLYTFASGGPFQTVTRGVRHVYTPGVDDGKTWYVRVEWQETYRESAKSFLEFVTAFLVPLGDPADTRLVFGFDS